MPITKSNLINDTAISSGTSRDAARIVIEQFLHVVKDTIKAANSLELRGFGTFSPKICNPRQGRNLKTGELIPLATSRSMSFKFSSELKFKIKGSAKQAVATEQVQAHELAKIGSL